MDKTRVRPRSPARVVSMVMVCIAMLLGGCSPREGDAAKGSTRPPVAESAHLVHIERQGRADPRASARGLQNLYAGQTPGTLDALEILALRGAMLGLTHQTDEAAQVIAQLQAWPNARYSALAKASARYVRARVLMGANRLGDALKEMQALDEAVLPQAPLLLRAQMLRTHARLMDATGNTEGSIALYLRALTELERTGHPWANALCRADLSIAYLHAQQPDQAASVIDEAMRLAESDPDPMTLNSVHTARSIVYSALGKSVQAEVSSQQAVHFARVAGANRELALGLANEADMYLRRGDFGRALRVSEEALPLARSAELRIAEIVALANIGLAKISMGLLVEGKASVEQAIELDRKQGAVSSVGDSYNELGVYLERAGDTAGAVDAYHRARRIFDESLKQEDRKTILELQERFDSEQRARAIGLLERDKTIAAEKLRKDTLQMRLWAVLAACFVVFSGLLFMLYKRVRKTNAALAMSNELLKVQGEMDPLTGLANRRHFQHAIKRLSVDGKLHGTVFLIDIDHFKRINDRYGHAAGDTVLVEVSHRLRQAVRAEDLVVRWGGEEFLIVIESRDADVVQALAQRLLDLIAAPGIVHAGQAIAVTASIGFACLPLLPKQLSVGWERAINLVDTVMYLAKAHGRNRAYGVSSIEVDSEEALDELAQSLDAAWREGRVGLSALQGPQVVGGADQ